MPHKLKTTTIEQPHLVRKRNAWLEAVKKAQNVEALIVTGILQHPEEWLFAPDKDTPEGRKNNYLIMNVLLLPRFEGVGVKFIQQHRSTIVPKFHEQGFKATFNHARAAINPASTEEARTHYKYELFSRLMGIKELSHLMGEAERGELAAMKKARKEASEAPKNAVTETAYHGQMGLRQRIRGLFASKDKSTHAPKHR